MLDDEAEETGEEEAEREGAESPIESIDTETMVDEWLRVLRLPAASEADGVEKQKLEDWDRMLTHLTEAVKNMRDTASNPKSHSHNDTLGQHDRLARSLDQHGRSRRNMRLSLSVSTVLCLSV